MMPCVAVGLLLDTCHFWADQRTFQASKLEFGSQQSKAPKNLFPAAKLSPVCGAKMVRAENDFSRLLFTPHPDWRSPSETCSGNKRDVTEAKHQLRGGRRGARQRVYMDENYSRVCLSRTRCSCQGHGMKNGDMKYYGYIICFSALTQRLCAVGVGVEVREGLWGAMRSR